MTLVNEGKVSLDDPVEKYLPEFADVWVAVERDDKHMLLERPKREITVRHVLSHTSGLPFKKALETPTLDSSAHRGARSYGVTPLEYQPGEGYRYSNAGINTAGRIIEVVSGMPYEKFMSARLFEPLGMNDTVIRPSKAQLRPRLAKGYKPNAAKDGLEETTISQLTYPLDLESRQPMPAGGYFSTADDIGHFSGCCSTRGCGKGSECCRRKPSPRSASDKRRPRSKKVTDSHERLARRLRPRRRLRNEYEHRQAAQTRSRCGSSNIKASPATAKSAKDRFASRRRRSRREVVSFPSGAWGTRE